MKIGNMTLTAESNSAPPMKTEEVIKMNEETPATPQVAEPAGVDEANIDNNPDETEAEQAADLAELSEASEENAVNDIAIEKQGDTVQSFFKAADELDAIQQSVDSSIKKTGSISPVSAEIIETTIESIFKDLDIARPVIPSNEAFSGTWTKKAASAATLESLEKSNESVGSKLIDMLRKIFESVMSFLAGLLRNRALLERHIRKLLERANKMQGDWTRKSDKIEGFFAHKLQIGDKADFSTVNRILTTAGHSVEIFDTLTKSIADIRDGRGGDDPGQDAINKLKSIVGKSTSTIEYEGKTTECYGAYPRNRALVIDDSGDSFNVAMVARKVGDLLPDMAAPDLKEIKSGLTTALSTIEKLRAVEGKVNRLKDMLSGFLRTLETKYQQLRGAMGSEEHAAKAKLAKEAKVVQTFVSKLAGKFPGETFSAVRNVGDWALAGMRNLEQKV